MSDFALTIENLVKVYKTGTKALKGVNLKIEAGDFFALLGANGAGKTTVIGIITDLVRKSSGKVKIFDYDIDESFQEAKKLIGVVPQEFNFNMFEKVGDIVATQAGYYGIPWNVALKDVEVVLKRLALWEKRNASARSLSGGMKRRLMIARALVHHPKLLILDEPTAGVDVELRIGMWEYLKELNSQGTTILLTTHYLEEVEQMCRHAAIIRDGEIIRQDSVRNLMQLMHDETYVLTVEEIKSLDKMARFNVSIVDEHTLEVVIKRPEQLNELISLLISSQFIIKDIHP
ncbi:MAG: ABC transporter ATP-binding protein, partial [Candidatus Omnitrophica bacterium]|nr:ABC transporter ATP-binding protein [Candidatus Omnitrophota bacterium]